MDIVDTADIADVIATWYQIAQIIPGDKMHYVVFSNGTIISVHRYEPIDAQIHSPTIIIPEHMENFALFDLPPPDYNLIADSVMQQIAEPVIGAIIRHGIEKLLTMPPIGEFDIKTCSGASSVASSDASIDVASTSTPTITPTIVSFLGEINIVNRSENCINDAIESRINDFLIPTASAVITADAEIFMCVEVKK